MESPRRYLLPLLAVVALAALGVVALRPAPVLVDVEAASVGPLLVTIEEDGHTRVIDRYLISSPIAAQSRRITLSVGDRVEQGQVLATLDALPPPALDVRALQQARARLAAAEASLSTASEEAQAVESVARFDQAEYRRVLRLQEQGLVARSLVEQAAANAARSEALARSARFHVQTMEFERDAAAAALAFADGADPQATGTLELRAPVPGVVLARPYESARVVQPGDALMEIGDPERLEVTVDVLSSDAVRIRPGMRVMLERWGDGPALDGRVRRVEPTAFTRASALGVEEQRVWVIVDIISPREDWVRLGHGYRVTARFVLWEAEEVLRVPTSALFRQGEGWAVFVEEQGRVRLQPVKTGQRSVQLTGIVDGMQAGQAVVVHPPRELADGSRVTVRTPDGW